MTTTTTMLVAPTAGVLLLTTGPSSDLQVNVGVLSVDRDARGAGAGTRALRSLCETADDRGWTVRLAATGDLGADLARLVAWYARHGFVPDRSQGPAWRNEVPMVRWPAR